MSVAIAKQKQGLLFSEPSIAETGVWCKLEEGIDPSEWARVCRHIGSLRSAEFECISAMLMPKPKPAPSSSIFTGLKRLLSFKPENSTGLPLVSIGPGKSGDAYQWEM